MTTLVVADDHPAARLGLRRSLDGRTGFRVVAEAHDADAAVAAVTAHRPDACVLDVHMPGRAGRAARGAPVPGGVAAVGRVLLASPGTRVVMLSASGRRADLVAALDAGACGYLLKDLPPDRLPSALRGALSGGRPTSGALAGLLLDELRRRGAEERADRVRDVHGAWVRLPPREHEVVGLLAEGATTRATAARLGLSPVTVRRHVSSAASRLGVTDRDALLALLREDPER